MSTVCSAGGAPTISVRNRCWRIVPALLNLLLKLAAGAGNVMLAFFSGENPASTFWVPLATALPGTVAAITRPRAPTNHMRRFRITPPLGSRAWREPVAPTLHTYLAYQCITYRRCYTSPAVCDALVGEVCVK